MIEVCFNELTVEPLCDNQSEIEERVTAYVDLLVKIQKYFGPKTKIRYEYGIVDVLLAKDVSLFSFCFAHMKEAKWRNKCQLLLSMSRKPYIAEGKEDASGFFDYDDVKVDVNGIKAKCMGLYCAFLYHSFAVGFGSDEIWKNNYQFCLLLTPSSKVEANKSSYCTQNVYCITDEKFLDIEDLVDWMVKNHSIPLLKTDVLPVRKTCHLRDDHGDDVIRKYFDRLRNCDYVVKCINSLPWNPTDKDMIRKVFPNGQIEIVLTNTDKGLGLVIETTASNIYQAKAIAKYIEKNYKC